MMSHPEAFHKPLKNEKKTKNAPLAHYCFLRILPI